MDAIEGKFGSWKNFFNISKDMLIRENLRGNIDQGMYEICKHFYDLGFKSVMCCSGHGKRKAYIKFCTDVKYNDMLKLVQNVKGIDVIEETHKKGNFKYVKIVFSLSKNVLDSIISLKL